MSSEEKKVSRRGYVKYAGAAVVVVAVGAAGAYYASQPPAPPPTTPVVTTPKPTTPVPTTPVPTTPVETGPPPAQDPLQFNIWDFRPDVVRDYAKLFEQQYDEKVNVSLVSGDYAAIMLTKLMAGAPVDLMYEMQSPGTRLYAAGYIDAIDDLPHIKEIVGDMYPNYVQYYTAPWDNKIFCLPYFCGVYFIQTNQALLEKHGMADDYPKTWTELYDKCRDLKKKGVETPLMRHWYLMPSSGGMWEQFVGECFNRGEELFDANFDPKFDVNTTIKDVLTDWRAQMAEGLVPKELPTGVADAISWFLTGKHAYGEEKNYDMRTFNDPERSGFPNKCSLVPYDKQTWGVKHLGVYLKVKQKNRTKYKHDRVNRLMEFYGWKDKEGKYLVSSSWAKISSLASAFPKVYEDPELRDIYKKSMTPYRADDFDRVLKVEEMAPCPPHYRTVWAFDWHTYTHEILPQVIFGSMKPEDAIPKLRDKAKELKEMFKPST